jgi:hypothetical protein
MDASLMAGRRSWKREAGALKNYVDERLKAEIGAEELTKKW